MMQGGTSRHVMCGITGTAASSCAALPADVDASSAGSRRRRIRRENGQPQCSPEGICAGWCSSKQTLALQVLARACNALAGWLASII